MYAYSTFLQIEVAKHILTTDNEKQSFRKVTKNPCKINDVHTVTLVSYTNKE